MSIQHMWGEWGVCVTLSIREAALDNSIHVEGFSAPSGEEWILVTVGSCQGWVPRREFHGSGKDAIDRLRRKNVIVIGTSHIKELLDRVAQLVHFPAAELVENIGWNGHSFALPDGTVFSPQNSPAGEVLFDHIQNRCAEKGTLRQWKRCVAKPLTGQRIATFVLCAAFAAPILKLTNLVGNFGFELVGAKGTGKSTFQQIMSSVLGGAIQGEDGHYWTSFDATPSGLEQAMASHSDLPMVLEEANLYIAEESPRVRGEHFKALAFRLAGGFDKKRYGQATAGESRFVYLTSSNEPLADLIGRNSETALAAADRLITIQIPSDRPHGLFDSIPERFASGSEFAKALIGAANQHHGKAIRRFLRKLVNTRADDEGRLKKEITALIARFCEKAQVDHSDGSAMRVAEAFGIVYAAGELAVRFGALPKGFSCGLAVLACYRLHLAKDSHFGPFESIVTEIAKRNDVIHLGKGKIADVDPIMLASTSAFVRNRGGHRELWIRPSKIEALIPRWGSMKKTPDVDALLKRDGRHRKVKRPVGQSGVEERVYCFRLPEPE